MLTVPWHMLLRLNFPSTSKHTLLPSTPTSPRAPQIVAHRAHKHAKISKKTTNGEVCA
jgi:hypothetical protein